MPHRGDVTTPLRPILASVLAWGVLAVSCVQDEPAADVSPVLTELTTTTVEPAAEFEWAAEAVVWTEALDTLSGELGGSAWSYFWAPDIEFDYGSMWPGAPPLRGEAAFSFMRSVLPPRANAASPDGAAFISTDGVVSMLQLDWAPSGMDTSPITATPGHVVNVLGPIGPNGSERMVAALASDSWRERRNSAVEPDEADDFASRWVMAWSGRDDRMADLYASDAELVDSIATITTRGSTDIKAMADAQLPASWTTTSLADGTATVYPITAKAKILDGLVLVVEGTDGSGCPHRLAVVLTVADGQIVREERFWPIEDARQCLPTEELPGGWWEGRELEVSYHGPIPEELATQTGLVQVNGVRIEIYNGNPRLEEAVRWAFGRFEIAGLPLPSLVEITFTSYAELCEEAVGRARLHDGNWSLYFCFDSDDLCVDDGCSTFAIGPKHVLLHELAHPWMRANLNDDDRDEFMSFVDLTVWSDAEAEWAEMAMEHAAESMAWGLGDQPFNTWRLNGTSHDQMDAQFELLTGSASLQPPIHD